MSYHCHHWSHFLCLSLAYNWGTLVYLRSVPFVGNCSTGHWTNPTADHFGQTTPRPPLYLGLAGPPRVVVGYCRPHELFWDSCRVRPGMSFRDDVGSPYGCCWSL